MPVHLSTPSMSEACPVLFCRIARLLLPLIIYSLHLVVIVEASTDVTVLEC